MSYNISTLSPLRLLPKREEVSPLRSPRDSSTSYNEWKAINAIITGYNQLIQVSNQMSREIKRIESRGTLDLDLFPFKLYILPDEFQVNTSPSVNWNLVNVRGGYVFADSFDTASSFVNGTDRMEGVSYLNILNTSTVGQYTVPTGSSQYWFWVEKSGSAYSGSSYFIRASETPDIPDDLYNPNGWDNFPSASAGIFVLGYADTETSGAYGLTLVRQIQVGDIITPPTILVNICNQETGVPEQFYLTGYVSSSLDTDDS